jgi:hypothetical protein
MARLVYPRIYSTDLDGLRFLATFGETGAFGGLATCFRSPGERESCAVTEGRFRHFLRRGSHALDLTKSAQEPESEQNPCAVIEQTLRCSQFATHNCIIISNLPTTPGIWHVSFSSPGCERLRVMRGDDARIYQCRVTGILTGMAEKEPLKLIVIVGSPLILSRVVAAPALPPRAAVCTPHRPLEPRPDPVSAGETTSAVWTLLNHGGDVSVWMGRQGLMGLGTRARP